nr:hypothetical protein [Tanacetum cinerariifolium]
MAISVILVSSDSSEDSVRTSVGLDDSARDSSPDSSSEASLDFHSDASSDCSSRHSLSDHSSWPSHKRCRYPMTSVPGLSPVSGALSPFRADLIPSHKRTSLKDDVMVKGSDEPHLEQDINPEIEAEINECFAYVLS